MARILYELAGREGRVQSPFVWRTKFALAHKGLAYVGEPVGFTQIPMVCEGAFKTVPILDDGGTKTCDSWAIADYLDATYPDAPLFATPAERGLSRFVDSYFSASVFPKVFPLYVKDVHDHARSEDQAYFRQTREKFFGKTLEEVVEDRAEAVPAARQALEPLRRQLGREPWLNGEGPGYGDYIGLSVFFWLKSVATMPLLAADDPLLNWIRRGADLHGGVGHSVPGTLTG